MHKTIITGNITRDGSTLRTTGNGDKVLGFSVGVSNGKDSNGKWRDKTFFDCAIWGKRAESLAAHLTADTSLTVFGRVSAREYNGKAYLQLSVDDFAFNSAPNKGGQSQGSSRNDEAPGYLGEGDSPSDIEDSIPF